MPDDSKPPYRQTVGLLLLVIFATTSLVLSESVPASLRTPLALVIAAIMALVILEAFIGLSRRQSGATLAVVMAASALIIMVLFVVLDVGTRRSTSTVLWTEQQLPVK